MHVSRVGPSNRVLIVELDEPGKAGSTPSESALFEDKIFPLVSRSGRPAVLVLDYAGRRSMSSEHLGFLLRLHHLAQDHAVELRLCGLDESQKELLHLTALDAFLEIARTRAEAIATPEGATASD